MLAEHGEVVAVVEFVGGRHGVEFSAWVAGLGMAWMGLRKRPGAEAPFRLVLYSVA